MAGNLWWSWNAEAAGLFCRWLIRNYSPPHNRTQIRMFKSPAARSSGAKVCVIDAEFSRRLAAVEKSGPHVFRARTWCGLIARQVRVLQYRIFLQKAEFAVHESLPQICSGALGVLAGDHVKSASDLGIPLVRRVILTAAATTRSEFNRDGSTNVIHPSVSDFAELPIEKYQPLSSNVPMG